MHPVRTYDEEALLAQLKAGDVQAFTQIYVTYSGQIYGNIFKMIKDRQATEEIVQDIFTCIWQKRDTLQFEHSFTAYLYRMGQNRVYDFYRRLQRDRRLFEKFKAAATERYEYIEETLYHKESEVLLQQALNTLSPQQKKVYQLCRLEGRSYKQAALQLGISPFTVKEYLSAASKAVRNYLTTHLDTAFSLVLLIIIRWLL